MKELTKVEMLETIGGKAGCTAAAVGWHVSTYGVVAAIVVGGPVGLGFAVAGWAASTWGVFESC